MTGALTRYRVMAYVTGVWLILLVCIAVPLKYLAGRPFLVDIVGPVHGIIYMIFLVTAYDLARRCRWSLTRTVLIALAGTIPFLSFVAERKVTAEWFPAAMRGSSQTPQ